MQIKDGKGRGYLAEVTGDNKLAVISSSEPRISTISSDKESSFSIYGRRNFAAAGTDEGILFLQYTGELEFHIDSIICAGNGTNNKVEVFVDSGYSSGGTTGQAINQNRQSSYVLDSNIYTGASTLTVTAGDLEVYDARFAIDTVSINFGGSLILGKNDTLYIKGEVATIADKIRVMILGYED